MARERLRVRVAGAQQQDVGKGIVRVDGLIRGNAKVGIREAGPQG